MEQINKRESTEIHQRLIENLRPILDILARSGVNLKIVRQGPQISLYFDHKTQECVINLDFLEEKGLKDVYEILFGCAHEVGHFIQMLEDPEGYERIFSLLEERAKYMASRVIQDPKIKEIVVNSIKERISEKTTEEEVLVDVFKQIYHQLMNVVLDINVNEKIKRRILPFREGPRSEIPQNIYRDKLFPSPTKGAPPDYQNLPYYSQFVYSLIRNYMTKEKAIVSERVAEAMEKKIHVLGREMNVEEIVESYIANLSSKAFNLYIYLKNFILPIFEKLLWEDIEQGRFRVISIETDLHGEENGHGNVLEEVKKWQEEKKKTSKEKQKELAKQQFEEAGKEQGFSEKEIEELWSIDQATAEVTNILKNIWYLFLKKDSIIYLTKQGVFRFGISPNISEVIKQLFIQKTPPQQAEVMERYIPEEKITLLPKKIKIVLVIDLSSSMKEKRRAVQEVSYSILQSLLRFSEEIKLRLNLPDFPIGAEFKIIGFGSSTIELPSKKELEDEIWIINQAILDIKRIDLGGTEDDKALRSAREFFTVEDMSGIKEGRTLGIVLEITDGETSTPNTSKNEVDEINSSGIFCRAIQIPGPIYSEVETDKEKGGERSSEIVESTGTFKQVWGEKGIKIQTISQLPDIIVELLREAIESYSQP